MNLRYLLLAALAWTCWASCSDPAPKEKAPLLGEIRLDPAEAADLARSIGQQVPARLAEGLEMKLWASDSLLYDPIALSMDPLGRMYVNATRRGGNSEFDIRGHMQWATASVSFQSVEDRRRFLRQEFSPQNSEKNTWLPDLNRDGVHDWEDLKVEKERIYRIEDRSGDGVADYAQIFAEDFHEEITDVANGVLYHEGDVYVSVAPDVWRLRDTDGDGQADTKESISHGWGVHIGFGGHGMSGLTVGPDGKLWWGIGDIGMNVVDKSGKRWAYPNQGVIARCNPDGSDFEVFAAGLRNTHEFVFDEYGNLITEDNDGDHPGEKERLVYLVDGSDSGWRINWQFGKYTDSSNNSYKVWMEEELYKPRFEGQAAYILPPLMNYHSGPSGMKYNPGTALGPEWQRKFFLVEFNGNPTTSGIHAFDLKPKGAGFEFNSEVEVMKGVLAVGIDFGPDGALYLNDWIDGWNVKGYGRAWRLDVAPGSADPRRPETQALLAASFAGKSEAELGALLRHADMRIRQKAQFELARRGGKGHEVLLAAARQTEHQLARVHGLWGMGQLARQDRKRYAGGFEAFLSDSDPEIVAQAAKLIGDIRIGASAGKLIPLLAHAHPRVRFFAAEALGRNAVGEAVQPLIRMLEANNDEDVYLRHAGSLALARIGQAEPLKALAAHPSRALRIAAVVALRRLADPGVALFLRDSSEYVVTEAARAINDDASIEAALPELARVLADPRFRSEALIRRAINANARVGLGENVELLRAYALRPDAPEALRAEAIAALGVWALPSLTDRVDGTYRGELRRDAGPVAAALAPVMPGLLASRLPMVQMEAAKASGLLRLAAMTPQLLDMARQGASSEARIAALKALKEMNSPALDQAIEAALAASDPALRAAAIRILPDSKLPEERAVALFSQVLRRGGLPDQQAALAALSRFSGPDAGAVLALQADLLIAGKLRPELQLDVLETAQASPYPGLQEKIALYQNNKPKSDPLAPFSEALAGGDARAGGRVMFNHAAAQCMRCHAIFEWGGNVGPNLAAIGKKYNNRILLESLVNPSARIADGYGTATLKLKDGQTLVGIVESETASQISLRIGNEPPRSIPKQQVAERENAPSSMPPMGTILTLRELRDLVAFLATLKGAG